MSQFENFVQTELPKRGYLDNDVAEETIIIRRGSGPRQFDAVTLAEGQVLALTGGVLGGVTLTGTRKAVVEVDVASTTWTLNHNLGSEDVIVQAFDANNSVIMPDSITVNDENTITIQFNSAQTGFARVLFLDDFALSGSATVGSGSGKSGYLLVREEQLPGTAPQTGVIGDNDRVLNTVVANTITGASLASNKITLPAGTYRISGSVPGYWISQSKLVSVSGDTVELVGTAAAYATSTAIASSGGRSEIKGQIVLTQNTVLKLVTNSKDAQPLGWSANLYKEIYSQLEVFQLA